MITLALVVNGYISELNDFQSGEVSEDFLRFTGISLQGFEMQLCVPDDCSLHIVESGSVTLGDAWVDGA